ncbi:MAG: hypothetical protein F6K63_14065 [Moorea sp. SIO1G6]|uniref:VMAP-C domain-containing protein n=1 Tax=Moorena sp. SIO1G6 TaxID=2607840 RepID=UPI0013C0554A|nr:effector-associated domain EAD1-containing protein [Moorena sp. SIO1G6]NET65443.1 hypothetical protein [Moorena sp. SIO1G6]
MNGGNTPGYLLEKINEALCSAFPDQGKLEMMVLYKLNISLKEVASGGNLKQIVHELLNYYVAQNKLPKLIDGALKENQNNPDLKAIKEKFKITTSLVNILLPLENNLMKQMQQAYQACCPDDYLICLEEDEIPENLDEILESFEDIPQPNDDEEIIVQFVAHLLKTGDIPKYHGDKLKQWIKQNANNPSDLLPQTSSHYQNHQQPNLDAQPYLLVKVDSSKQYQQQRQPNYLVSAWFIPDLSNYDYVQNHQSCKFLETTLADGESEQDLFSIEELPKLIESFLNQSRQYDREFCDDTILVFSLPYQLLNYEIERINITNYFGLTLPICKEYKVVIRSVKRFERFRKYPKDYYRKTCITKWKIIKYSSENKCHQEFVDVSKFDFNWEKLHAYLKPEKMTKKAIALKLYNPPCDNILKVIDTTAIPVALWLRKNDFTTINCQDELDKLLNCKINELPEKVQEQRLKAPNEDNGQEHIGHHLALLWEDPYLLPPQIDYTTL